VRVLDEHVDDSVAESIVAKKVAQEIQSDESHAQASHVLQRDDVTRVEPLQVHFEVRHLGIRNCDALLARIPPFAIESVLHQLGGLGCDALKDRELFLLVAFADADDGGVDHVEAAINDVSHLGLSRLTMRAQGMYR
jgi:hypothetical protein